MSNDVQAILNLLNSATLTPRELIEIERRARELSQASMSERSVARREQHLAQARICPHCGMQKALKFGRDVRGRQRFRCRSVAEGGCGKTFTALTGTAFSGMRRRDQWGAFEAANGERLAIHRRAARQRRSQGWTLDAVAVAASIPAGPGGPACAAVERRGGS